MHITVQYHYQLNVIIVRSSQLIEQRGTRTYSHTTTHANAQMHATHADTNAHTNAHTNGGGR